jgi:Tol biopolymer transport system component/predicted Ser/Thr protein kinase
VTEPARRRRAEEVCDAALDRDAGERAAFVATACGHDQALRQEVEALLAHAQTAEGFLAAPIGAVAAQVLGEAAGASMVGRQIGAYTILSHLGAGGMGEVYKATDTRLNRAVAIKVLPHHGAADPELRQRFEREAKTLAALSHAHICPIHDVGSQDGIDFLVMEYLDGETLEQRLKRGALPLAQALQIGIQIADALTAAHRAGIIHRDLKPGNIMLTTSGAKLLDFGLAKLRPTEVATGMSRADTVSRPLTGQGTLLGTLHYMAPEQVEGKEADNRSDLFSFGAVVYEMVTGKRAFEGKSQASLIAAILERQPVPMSSLQPMSPPALDRVVTKCLSKNPDRRWQTARDLHDELQWVADAGAHVGVATSTRVTRSGGRAWLVGSFLLAFFTAFAAWYLKPAPPASQSVTRFAITLQPGDRLPALIDGPQASPVVGVSPDGRYFAYIAVRNNTQQIFVRAVDGTEARPVAGSEGASGNLVFSSDGEWISYTVAGDLRKIPRGGGKALSLGSGFGSGIAAWGETGTLIFGGSGGGPNGLQMAAAGGPRHALTRPEKDELHRLPDVLPGQRGVLFTSGARDTPRVSLYSTATRESRDLIDGGTFPRYAASGHLLYAQNGALFAVPFDAERLEVRGSAVPILESVVQAQSGAAQYGISTTGTLIYLSDAGTTPRRQLVWVARDGTEQPLPAPIRGYDWPRLSPDGRRIAVEVGAQTWMYDIERDTFTRFAFEGTQNDSPVWTPDSRRIAFRSNRDGPLNIYWQWADGSGGTERLTMSQQNQIPGTWSTDGQLLAFHANAPTTLRDIWVLPLDDRKPRLFLQTPANEGAPRFSPDGKWVAYASNESGRPEVYVQPYPGPGGKWQISADGGTEPVWNRNGHELFYRSGSRMMSVPVVTDTSFAVGKPALLFDGAYVAVEFPLVAVNYDVSADGERFLLLKEEPTDAATPQINVVLNWFEELKGLVPAN